MATDSPSYPLLHATRSAFQAHKDENDQNAGLIFDRFMPPLGADPSSKKKALEQTCRAAQKADRRLLKALNARWELIAYAIGSTPFSLKTEWRLVTGLGRKGPLEVGFTFNRFGFPILPGSSLKGVARAYALYQLAETLQDQLYRQPNQSTPQNLGKEHHQLSQAAPLSRLELILSIEQEETFLATFTWCYGENSAALDLAKQFRAAFGTTAAAGGAIFIEAIPKENPKLVLDIMNPHFPQYYQGVELPTNWQSPIPVLFLTVADNVEYRFAVGWSKNITPNQREGAEKWLIGGITLLGAGAKTSAGYGYFKAPTSASTMPTTAPVQPTQTASTPLSASRPRGVSKGVIRHEGNRSFVIDREDPTIRLSVDWPSLQMDALKKGTAVKYTYEMDETGKRKIVQIDKDYGGES